QSAFRANKKMAQTADYQRALKPVAQFATKKLRTAGAGHAAMRIVSPENVSPENVPRKPPGTWLDRRGPIAYLSLHERIGSVVGASARWPKVTDSERETSRQKSATA